MVEIYHEGEKGVEVMAKSKHLTEQEKIDWDNLYQYVRHNVLGYDNNQSLSRSMVLRLKGLLTNKFMANNNIEDTASYTYQLVLNTFKFCMPDIQRGLRSNSFRDENHKFNYVMKIVESNLNTVYMRMKNSEKSKEKTESISIDTTHNGADYQAKTSKTSKKLDDLW
jgi:hypothetical protein